MNERRRQYPFDVFEPKWQRHWDEACTFHTPNPGQPGFNPKKPKYYVLDMFPYPSGAGLHVGHPEGYTATDIIARYKRMQGANVLHPMGWDAFGLPAEQYAIKTGQHPETTTRQNVETFKGQLKRLGFAYDWSREVNTTDPGYYRWTQWIFLQLYNAWFNPDTQRAEPIDTCPHDDKDSHRLAYVSEAPVNWCPELGTVLANEEVVDGRSEVGGFPVIRRPMRQWMLRITAYAERLIRELDPLAWPDSIKTLQRNWIGRSEGALVEFKVASASGPCSDKHGLEAHATIKVFTTRPDTLFGATYMVLAPEHQLVEQITTEDQWNAVREYREKTARKSDLERTDLAKDKTGVFTGACAINPVNEERIPIWIADYVLLGYGTGAIMAVPAHDERDWAFAKTFNLPIRQVVTEFRGIGFQPMIPTQTFQTADPYTPVEIREGANLPHWTQGGKSYAVTFRLADSLPAHAVERMKEEITQLRESATERARLAERVEAYLDSGAGACWLRDDRIAEIVAIALAHFDGERYHLLAWCVMPNHVHVIVQPMGKHHLTEILHSWKSFTATKANEVLGRAGPFWQAESYDRLIRDEREFLNQVEYIRQNPQKGDLQDWKWVWDAWGSQKEDHRLEADATCFTGDGFAINSPLIDGLPTAEAKAKITAWLEQNGVGEKTVNYKLRDWLFSRQRYWGEPFPIVWENGRHRALDDAELPVTPPPLADFKPTGAGEPPLARAKDWVRYSDTAIRETNTMPQWAGSCWYYLRYCDSQNAGRFVGEEAERYWMNVDLYVGGTEHAVLHLLYARFWHKVLFDLGHVSTPEPFQRLVNQGIILGEDGQKMSKSRGNVVNPDSVVAQYGADSFRLYEMFMGPLEQMKPWSMKGVEGVYRFLARVWRLVMAENQAGEWELGDVADAPESDKARLKVIHATIKKVTEDIESLSFNTAISQMMIFVNAFTNVSPRPVSALRTLLVLLNPFAPHITSELWEILSRKFPGAQGDLADQPWPAHDGRFLIEDEIEIVIQVNGKLRDKLMVDANATKEQLEQAALQSPKVAELLAGGKQPRKVIAVPGRLVNVVL